MTTRRSFLATLAAGAALPATGWAGLGAPVLLAAGRWPDGGFRIAGMDAGGGITFTTPLPERGHAAAAHPHRPLAVAFARRPGTFALVIDCTTGTVQARLTPPSGHHFYGHGTFSADDTLLFTTENAYELGQGRIGIWDTRDWSRIGAVDSGGTGPHDMALMPDGKSLVVANGGIETHPDSGRAKLNLATMRPNLTYLGLDGEILDRVELSDDLHRNSIRHLALAPDGTVAFAMQWQGDAAETPPLLGLHRRGAAPRLLAAPGPLHARLRGYAGSVALSQGAALVAITSPRGGVAHLFDIETGAFLHAHPMDDICGLAAAPDALVCTSGTGAVARITRDGAIHLKRHDCNWDNHLVPGPRA